MLNLILEVIIMKSLLIKDILVWQFIASGLPYKRHLDKQFECRLGVENI